MKVGAGLKQSYQLDEHGFIEWVPMDLGFPLNDICLPNDANIMKAKDS